MINQSKSAAVSQQYLRTRKTPGKRTVARGVTKKKKATQSTSTRKSTTSTQKSTTNNAPAIPDHDIEIIDIDEANTSKKVSPSADVDFFFGNSYIRDHPDKAGRAAACT